jgi:hypothetical protein
MDHAIGSRALVLVVPRRRKAGSAAAASETCGQPPRPALSAPSAVAASAGSSPRPARVTDESRRDSAGLTPIGALVGRPRAPLRGSRLGAEERSGRVRKSVMATVLEERSPARGAGERLILQRSIAWSLGLVRLTQSTRHARPPRASPSGVSILARLRWPARARCGLLPRS